MSFVKVGIVGCGLMGAGIAEVAARAGKDVVVAESSTEAAEVGLDRIRKSLERAEARGKIASAGEVLESVRLVTDLSDLADRDLVVEAIVEDESSKVDLFRRLDEIVASPKAVLASNTSSIPIMKLAVATGRPSHVLGVHFFNPVPGAHTVPCSPRSHHRRCSDPPHPHLSMPGTTAPISSGP